MVSSQRGNDATLVEAVCAFPRWWANQQRVAADNGQPSVLAIAAELSRWVHQGDP